MEKYLGLVSLAVILFYVFKNPGGPQATGDLVKSIADANVNAISALQGRNGTAY